MNKKIATIKDFSKGPMNKLSAGSFYHSQNIEFDRRNPYIIPAHRFFQEKAFDEFDYITGSTNYDNSSYLCNTNGKIFKNTAGTWNLIHTVTPAVCNAIFGDSILDAGTETGNLYYVSNTNVGKFDGLGWTDAWQTLKVNNGSNQATIIKFLKFICISNLEYLAVYDIGADSFNNERLKMPNGFNIKWMKATTDFLIIGANHSTLGGIIVLWDGISTTYNSVIDLGDVLSYGADVDNNICYILTDDGWISSLTGGSSNLQKLQRLPDYEDRELSSHSPRLINANAIKFYNGLLYFGMTGAIKDLNKRYTYSGIYVYDPIKNVTYFKNALSGLGVIGNTESTPGAINLIHIDTYTNLLRVAWSGGNSAIPIVDILKDSSGSKTHYQFGAFIITNFIDGNTAGRKRFMQVITNLLTELPELSTAKVIIRYSESDKISKKIVKVLSGSTNYFLIGIANSEDIDVGDEVCITDGQGISQIRNITKKEVSGVNYKFTVDRALDNSKEFDSSTYVSISDFKLIEILSGDTFRKDSKLSKFHFRGKRIRLKIEFCSPQTSGAGDSIGLRDISSVFVEDKIIKI